MLILMRVLFISLLYLSGEEFIFDQRIDKGDCFFIKARAENIFITDNLTVILIRV